MADEVLSEVRGRVLLVTLNRPDARNAVDSALAQALLAATERLDEDKDLTAGVLTGALTRYHFGDQNMGGPVQIMGQGGVSFDLGWNLFAGWRFHHISDATLYGSHSKGVDINFIELRYHF